MLTLACINSGSNGNCYYVGNDTEAILVDAGISCREILTRMKSAGLKPEMLRGIFITHEHSDHIRGVEVLAKRLHLPVYTTRATYNSGKFPVDPQNLRIIAEDEIITVGRMTVTAFSKRHDAAEPLSFTVEQDGNVIGIMTDIGSVCEKVVYHYRRCNAVILEANYDEEMLRTGPYPYVLKRRIQGNHGHLSNSQALELFLEHSSDSLSHLILGHLSKENNCPTLVQALFEKHADRVHVEVASRYGVSAVHTVVPGQFLKSGSASVRRPVRPVQLALFD